MTKKCFVLFFKCSTSLSTREMQTKTTWRSIHTPVRMTHMEKWNGNKENAGEEAGEE